MKHIFLSESATFNRKWINRFPRSGAKHNDYELHNRDDGMNNPSWNEDGVRGVGRRDNRMSLFNAYGIWLDSAYLVVYESEQLRGGACVNAQWLYGGSGP